MQTTLVLSVVVIEKLDMTVMLTMTPTCRFCCLSLRRSSVRRYRRRAVVTVDVDDQRWQSKAFSHVLRCSEVRVNTHSAWKSGTIPSQDGTCPSRATDLRCASSRLLSLVLRELWDIRL